MNSREHTDITSFALGELTPADAQRVRQLLAQSPEARAEYERLTQTIRALRDQAALPQHALHPEQREAVLAAAPRPVAQKPRIVNFPVSQAKRTSPFWIMANLAAAACLALGAFIAGQKTATHTTLNVADAKPTDKTSNTISIKLAESKTVEKEATPVEKNALLQETKQTVVAATTNLPKAPAPDSVKELPVIQANVREPSQAPAIAQSKPIVFAATQTPLTTFTSVTNQHQETTFYFHPKMVKPVTQSFANKEIILAAPLPYSAKSASLAEPKRKIEQPALIIHTWKAEIASCPWDASRRLMRITAQIPVDQPAVEANDQDYRIVAKFDPFQVQGYRLVAEKHMQPSNGGTLATRFAWYEIIPTRNFAPSADKPITLGTLEIAQPKNAATNRDSAPLRLVDRGLKWNEAREDYVFETAMIGFSLLMQGTPNVGSLDHRMVMEIAEKAKDEDPKGERAKFIKAVQQAQRAAGL